jgi:hypothetical protein
MSRSRKRPVKAKRPEFADKVAPFKWSPSRHF